MQPLVYRPTFQPLGDRGSLAMLVGLIMCMALSAAALTLTLMRANPFRPRPLSIWPTGFMHKAARLDGSCARCLWVRVWRSSSETVSLSGGINESVDGAARCSVAGCTEMLRFT